MGHIMLFIGLCCFGACCAVCIKGMVLIMDGCLHRFSALDVHLQLQRAIGIAVAYAVVVSNNLWESLSIRLAFCSTCWEAFAETTSLINLSRQVMFQATGKPQFGTLAHRN